MVLLNPYVAVQSVVELSVVIVEKTALIDDLSIIAHVYIAREEQRLRV